MAIQKTALAQRWEIDFFTLGTLVLQNDIHAHILIARSLLKTGRWKTYSNLLSCLAQIQDVEHIDVICLTIWVVPVYYNSKHSPYRKFVFIFLYSKRIPSKYRWASKIHPSIFHHVMKRHPYDILRTRTGGDQRIRKISFFENRI